MEQRTVSIHGAESGIYAGVILSTDGEVWVNENTISSFPHKSSSGTVLQNRLPINNQIDQSRLSAKLADIEQRMSNVAENQVGVVKAIKFDLKSDEGYNQSVGNLDAQLADYETLMKRKASQRTSSLVASGAFSSSSQPSNSIHNMLPNMNQPNRKRLSLSKHAPQPILNPQSTIIPQLNMPAEDRKLTLKSVNTTAFSEYQEINSEALYENPSYTGRKSRAEEGPNPDMKVPPLKLQTQVSTEPLVDDEATPRTPSLHNGGSQPRRLPSLSRTNSQVYPIIHKSEDNSVGEKVLVEMTTSSVSCSKVIVNIIACCLVGMVFGWMLQKSAVYKPRVIRNQFLFTEFIMLKTFLAALAASQLSFVVLSMVPQAKQKLEKAKQSFVECISSKGILHVLSGGFLLGSGMAVSAACPGMVLAQVGSAVPNSAYTVLGGLLGCLLYGFIHESCLNRLAPEKTFSSPFINKLVKMSYITLAVPCMVMLIAVIILMEIFIPEMTPDHQHVLKMLDTKNITMVVDQSASDQSASELGYCHENNWFTRELWYPSICGVFIGLLQFPLVLVLEESLGSSSGYMTLTSQWLFTQSCRRRFIYFEKFRHWSTNYWQVALLAGVLAGAAAAAASSCTFLEASGPPWWQALLGGFIMLFGSRFASGCTSGHGISGAALMVAVSWLGVPAMFGGGIITAFIMKFSETDFYEQHWQP